MTIKAEHINYWLISRWTWVSQLCLGFLPLFVPQQNLCR